MWASRVLRMAVTKTSTGLVGLPVNPNARQDLIKLYRRTLQEILPPEAKNYRNAVEQITNYRLNVVETNEDEDTIERTINCGQLEELIEQAEDELSVIPVYLEHKLWESPVEAAK
ncbi:ndufa5, NADH-ubiquinone oxidoreductase subunit [Phytophthora boehmeriae]|uniref:Ndufa5, NADH-ubiquinone oxidoreductase subunit n=1 Tax=Phytophthora boehmeriae TaxID=109152 RepID=A0A8T1WVM4_9STRA|nr:ndufa5, NADH-ubiquinone oxidoreductase subunit [Phytophthora boehmeriae]